VKNPSGLNLLNQYVLIFFDYSPLEPLWIRFQAPKKEYITREWFCDIPTECYIVDSCSDIAMGDDVPVLKMILF